MLNKQRDISSNQLLTRLRGCPAKSKHHEHRPEVSGGPVALSDLLQTSVMPVPEQWPCEFTFIFYLFLDRFICKLNCLGVSMVG